MEVKHLAQGLMFSRWDRFEPRSVAPKRKCLSPHCSVPPPVLLGLLVCEAPRAEAAGAGSSARRVSPPNQLLEPFPYKKQKIGL